MKILLSLLLCGSAWANDAKEAEQGNPWVTPKEKGGPMVEYTVPDEDIAKTAPGGMITVFISEKIKAAANTKNVKVQVVGEDGKEILRVTGDDAEPVTLKVGFPYEGVVDFNLPKPWKGKLTLKVWNAITHKMWTYTLEEPEEGAESETDPFSTKSKSAKP